MNAKVELPQAREVCPTTTRRLLAEGSLLVDVRELAEVAQVAFDVHGVLLMPLSELEQRYAELPRDRDLVIACQVGQRSLKAAYFLMYQGFTRVASMEGGLSKWARKGFPIKGTAAAHDDSSTNGCCGASARTSTTSPCCGGEKVGSDASAGSNTCCTPSPAGASCC